MLNTQRVPYISVPVIVCAASLMGAGRADAGTEYFLEAHFERTVHRAMGGVEVALDPRTPAISALNEHFDLTILEADIYTTLSEGLSAYSLFVDLYDNNIDRDFDTSEDFEEAAAELEDLSERIVGDQYNFEAHARLDALHLIIPLGNFSLGVGAYSELTAGSLFTAPQKIEVVDNGVTTFIDLGESVDLLAIGARMDIGGFASLGTAFSLSDALHLGVGGTARVFQRNLWEEFRLTAQAQIRNAGDVDVQPEDPVKLRGIGVGVDLYTVLQQEFRNIELRYGLRIEDVFKWIKNGDEDAFFVPPRLALGFALSPRDHRLTFGLDLERVETGSPTAELGFSFLVGPPIINMAPAFGIILNNRDYTGAELDPAVTFGLRMQLSVVRLALVGEFQTASNAFNAGLSVGVSYWSREVW